MCHKLIHNLHCRGKHILRTLARGTVGGSSNFWWIAPSHLPAQEGVLKLSVVRVLLKWNEKQRHHVIPCLFTFLFPLLGSSQRRSWRTMSCSHVLWEVGIPLRWWHWANLRSMNFWSSIPSKESSLGCQRVSYTLGPIIRSITMAIFYDLRWQSHTEPKNLKIYSSRRARLSQPSPNRGKLQKRSDKSPACRGGRKGGFPGRLCNPIR